MNQLQFAHSPYLKQHAHNPVDWHEWNDTTLEKARSENKPVIVSIGYSACHWCHVMERESFENEQVAQIMNKNFISIKIDREERPDIDAIYMDSLQAMGQRGGWPLNAFLMPTGEPFYAGTYFPTQDWINLLTQIVKVFQTQNDDLQKSAQNFKQIINASEVEKYGLSHTKKEINFEILESSFEDLIDNFDTRKGGMEKAPKFIMPCLWEFLLLFSQISTKNILTQKALQQTELTLFQIGLGGINDQIGGGFARYSVDENWFAPHFEKMLYDNAQLLSLYSDAYLITKKKFYYGITISIYEFLLRELQAKNNGFLAAIDADSEGIEGKFYVWHWQELEKLWENNEKDLADFNLFVQYYQIEKNGNWEENQNILYCEFTPQTFAQAHQISEEIIIQKIKNWKHKLFTQREKRIKPSTDYKIITAWNGLTLTGLCRFYRSISDTTLQKNILENAEKLAFFIQNTLFQNEKLYRQEKNNQGNLTAYLEDYACVIEGFLALYQTHFNKKYIDFAEKLMQYCMKNFWDEAENLFFYTDVNAEKLIARKKEIFDNVMPASNSMMAKNLFYLGNITSNQNYIDISLKMCLQMTKLLENNIEYLGNWAYTYTLHTQELAQIVIVGKQYLEASQKIIHKFKTNFIVLAAENENNDFELFEGKTSPKNKTLIYICYGKTCQKPIEIEEI
ncbi:MAG: thioredoxin domain-containing protein [Bacteroidetes bacterium]|nr:MAG: thioredoxin domain-containing protein [Bacteroidota bacterium]TAG89141.1 MAG: thioredoxin domain-containing protein [Bacteroidota bacterium]